MVWMEAVDDFIAWIKDHLPANHELQGHKLFPGIKWDGKPIFIVDDDTTGEYVLMDFEGGTKRGRRKDPIVKVFASSEEVQALIEKDHEAEVAKCVRT